MYHFQGAPPGVVPPYQPPRLNQFAGYPPQPQGPPGPQAPYPAYQQTEQAKYGQFESTQQPLAPGVYSSGQTQQSSSDYASNRQSHYQQYKQGHGSNQAHRTGGHPHGTAYQSPSQACYNCGNSDHWAQNCPEPRRATPAGSLSGSRPLKRQKTTGPIVTRYPPPPSHSTPPSLQRGFTHPPVGHQTYPTPQGPPAPFSANGQGYNAWRQQQNPFVSQAPRQPNQPWSAPALTPTSSYGPQYVSPVSRNGSTQNQDYFNSQPHSAVSQASPSGNPIPLHLSTTVEPSSYPKQSSDSLRNQSVSSDRKQVPEGNVENVEPWLAELQSLDFTEGKVGSGPIISHPANPVAQPLPSDCAAADAIGRLPIAASLPPGVSISMYFRGLDEQEFEQNVRDKAEWNEVSDDPAFVEISSNCDAVSVSELIKRRQDETLLLDGSDDEAKASDYDTHSRDQCSDDERHIREQSFSDRSLTPFEAKPPIPREGSRTSRSWGSTHPTDSIEHDGGYPFGGEAQDQRLSREQEERLAALGVSGLPKPVQPSMRHTVAVKQTPKASLASPTEIIERQSRSTSLDKRATHAKYHASPSSDSFAGHSRDHSRDLSRPEESPHKNGYASRDSPRRHFSDENSYQDCDSHEPLSRYGSYDERHPPPPPPPPARKHRCFDGTPGRHSSPSDNHIQPSTRNGHGKSPNDEDTNQFDDVRSPSGSRSDPHTGRKRSYRHSSEESDDGPKRQAEENAQQRRRKHPNVAAAYSRRW